MDSLHTHLIPRHITSQNNAPGLISDSAEDDWTEDALVEEEPERKSTIYVIPRSKPQVNPQTVIRKRQSPTLPYHLWIFGPVWSEIKAVSHALNQLLGYSAKEVDVMGLIMREYHRQLHEFSPNELADAENRIAQALVYNGECTIARVEEGESSFSTDALKLMRQNWVFISLEENDPESSAQRVIDAVKRGEKIPLPLSTLSRDELIRKFSAIYQAQENVRNVAHVHANIGSAPIPDLVRKILANASLESFLS